MDIFSFQGDTDRENNGKGSFPAYLYDDTVFNDYKYLLSLDTLKVHARAVLEANYLGVDEKRLNPDTANYWGDDFVYSTAIVMREWQKSTFNRNYRKNDFAFEKMKNSFDGNILSLLREYPAVQFIIFFPPYSILAWVDCDEKGLFEDLMRFKQYVSETAIDLPNVKIYDLQDVSEITFNLNNYKDISHYSPLINTAIIGAIVKDEYRLARENTSMHINTLRYQLREYKRKNSAMLL
jgi:hypothetical protein